MMLLLLLQVIDGLEVNPWTVAVIVVVILVLYALRVSKE